VLLAVDIGNSQTSFGIFESQKLKRHWRAETRASRTADEYASLLLPLLQREGWGAAPWEGIMLCSVVPAAEAAFHEFCEAYSGMKPFKVTVNEPLGFGVNVEVPSQVGADRLANTAYAVARLPLPSIIVDVGTAITFDVISANRCFEGGVIIPGVRMAMEALARGTAKLPSIDLTFPETVIGKNTIECIQGGILYGYCDLLDGLLDRSVSELGAPPSVALTGGLASIFQHRLRTPTRYLPNLTLEGIEILYRAFLAKPI
jgi:type III pantothenate kinase